MHRRAICFALVLSACPKDPGATDTTTDTATDTGATASSTGPDEPTGTTVATSGACTPLVQGFTDPPLPSGWVQCGDQLPHRAKAVACAVPATPGTCAPDAETKDCETDADCTERPFGKCHTFIDIIGPVCSCNYGCQTDADCEPGTVCRCAGDGLGPYTECVSSSCTDDTACGDGRCQFATSFGNGCGFGLISGTCTTPTDTCDRDEQCDVICIPYESKWQCVEVFC